MHRRNNLVIFADLLIDGKQHGIERYARIVPEMILKISAVRINNTRIFYEPARSAGSPGQ